MYLSKFWKDVIFEAFNPSNSFNYVKILTQSTIESIKGELSNSLIIAILCLLVLWVLLHLIKKKKY